MDYFINQLLSNSCTFFFFKFVNGILRNWESLCDIRPDCHHHFDASGTSNAMFDELAERSLMSPLAGTKHTYVRLAIIIYFQLNYILAIAYKSDWSGFQGRQLIDQRCIFVEAVQILRKISGKKKKNEK